MRRVVPEAGPTVARRTAMGNGHGERNVWPGTAVEEDDPKPPGRPAERLMEEERASFPVRIPPFGLDRALTPPRAGKGLVLFAHGSGRCRFSPPTHRAARQAGRGLRREGE